MLWLVANQQNCSNFLTNSPPSFHFFKELLDVLKMSFFFELFHNTDYEFVYSQSSWVFFFFLFLFFKPMQPSEDFCWFFWHFIWPPCLRKLPVMLWEVLLWGASRNLSVIHLSQCDYLGIIHGLFPFPLLPTDLFAQILFLR